jgi:hypothetical protein
MRTGLFGWIPIVSHTEKRVKRKSFRPLYYSATLMHRFFPVSGVKLCYTMFALNASVVLCGPSGLDLLRLPALRFLRSFLA